MFVIERRNNVQTNELIIDIKLAVLSDEKYLKYLYDIKQEKDIISKNINR